MARSGSKEAAAVRVNSGRRESEECVVLLHGLGHSPVAMLCMQGFLQRRGFACINVGYPSRERCIELLAEGVRREIEERCGAWKRLHAVTHSMGGLVVRQMQKALPNPKLGRVVMLAPPNHGSEIVNELGDWWWFKAWNGPAAQQLRVGEGRWVDRLGPVNFELGVIAGIRRGPALFGGMLQGQDDGKVSVQSTRVEGMKEHFCVRSAHTFISANREAQEATERFLKSGTFAAV